jgi:outer membrane protein OmpA-like peptidoglycan-associated protein
MGERIAFYKTALSGTDPERAQQLGDLEQQAQAAGAALASEQQARQAAETEYQARLTEANESIDELNSEIQDLETQLTESESALEGLQSKHEAALEEHSAGIAASEGRVQEALDAHARTKAEAEAALQAANDEQAARMAEASGRIATLESDLKETGASLAALRQEHETKVGTLNSRISEGEQALAKLQADLAAANEAANAAARAHEQEITQARQQYSLLDDTRKQEQAEAQALLKRTRDSHASEVDSLQARITKAQRSLELLSDFRDKGGRLTDEGFMIDLATTELQFAGGKAELPPGELPTLDLIVQALNEFPGLRVRIDGHTDAAGDEEPNLELSRQRAAAVMQGLADRGVPAERMTSEGYGETRPIASNDTWEGRRQNRRVEIYILEP